MLILNHLFSLLQVLHLPRVVENRVESYKTNDPLSQPVSSGIHRTAKHFKVHFQSLEFYKGRFVLTPTSIFKVSYYSQSYKLLAEK